MHTTRTVGTLVDLGPRPWLVLGGGGMKGLAHLGSWKAIQEAGLNLSGLVGCSIGALVGALIAAEMPLDDMFGIGRTLEKEDIIRVNRRAVWVNGIKAISVFRGDVLRDYIEQVLPVQTWGALRRPLQVNAVSLSTGRTEWFGPGARTDVELLDAVYASAALPVFYPPARIGSEYFVDGGIDHALPLERPQELGATSVIAIDVGTGGAVDAETVVSLGMVSVHQRVTAIMSARRRQELRAGWKGVPLLYIRPRLDGFGTFDFESLDYFVEEGYRATREALEALE